MKLTQVSAIAKKHSIVPGKLPKSKLIKLIQSKEGNFDCYSSAHAGECDQGACLWREDCFDDARIAEPAGA